MFKRILKSADISSIPEEKLNSLYLDAAAHGDISIMKLLFEKNMVPDMDVCNKKDQTSAVIAGKERKDDALLLYLEAQGVDLSKKDEKGHNAYPFHPNYRNLDINRFDESELIKEIASHHIGLGSVTINKKPLSFEIAQRKFVNAFKTLLGIHGTRLLDEKHNGIPLTHESAKTCEVRLLEAISQTKADALQSLTDNGSNPLHFIVLSTLTNTELIENCIEAAKFLLEQHPNLSEKSNKAEHIPAYYTENPEMITLLAAQTANPEEILEL